MLHIPDNKPTLWFATFQTLACGLLRWLWIELHLVRHPRTRPIWMGDAKGPYVTGMDGLDGYSKLVRCSYIRSTGMYSLYQTCRYYKLTLPRFPKDGHLTNSTFGVPATRFFISRSCLQHGYIILDSSSHFRSYVLSTTRARLLDKFDAFSIRVVQDHPDRISPLLSG
jgi:hypothetical protein